MNKSKLYKVLEVICHILGFPIFLLAVILIDLKVFKNGSGYGIFPYVSIILVVVGAIIYYAAYFILRLKSKKQGEKTKERMNALARQGHRIRIAHPARNAGVVLAIIVIVCTCGLWAFVDLVLPDPLAGATSNTLYWEDLSDNWEERADVNKELLDTFITRSYYAGTLNNKTLDEYLDEGVTNEDVQVLLEKEFASIDKNGYGTLIGPSIDFATNERMTIPALMHLLLDEREPLKDENGARLDKAIPITTFKAVHLGEFADAALEVGGLYTYLRSAGKYSILKQKTDQTGNVGSAQEYDLSEVSSEDKLKIFESRPGFLKVQYLDSYSGSTSYSYTMDTNGGNLHFVYDEVVKDIVIKEVEINQKSKSEFELVVLDGEDIYTYVIQGSGVLYQENGVYGINTDTTFTYSLSVNGEIDVTSDTTSVSSTSDFILSTAIADANNFFPHASDDHAIWNENSLFSEELFYDCIILEKTTVEIYASWNVLDMLGEPMGMSLPLDSIMNMEFDLGALGKINIGSLLTDNPHLINDVFSAVSALASNDMVVGSKLTVAFDLNSGEISLIPANEERGTLDYMKQAWLNSNGLIFLLVSFFSLRKVTLIYAPILALLSFAIGVLLELQDKEREKEEKENNDHSLSEEPLDDLNELVDLDC